MKLIKFPTRLSGSVRRLHPATTEECGLVGKRARHGLTEDEAHRLRMLQHAADVAAEQNSEGRTHRGPRMNPHD